jgi:hypothetical protein
MDAHLYLVVAENWPEFRVENESHIIVDVGLEDYDRKSDIPIDVLNFMSTLLVNSNDPRPAVDEFRTWWSEIADGRVSLEILATAAAHLSPSRATDLKKVTPGEWSFRPSFIAFRSASQAAYAEAKGIILQAEMLLH